MANNRASKVARMAAGRGGHGIGHGRGRRGGMAGGGRGEAEVGVEVERVGDQAWENLFFNDIAKAQYEFSKGRKCLSTKVFKSDNVEDLKFDYVLKYFKLHHLDGLLTLDNPVYLKEVNQLYATFSFDDSLGDYGCVWLGLFSAFL